MWRDIAFIVTITLNIFITIGYSAKNSDKTKNPSNNESQWTKRTMNPILGLDEEYVTMESTRELF